MTTEVTFRSGIARVCVFVFLMACWYFAFWWGAIPVTLFYLWRYTAYELIILGVLIDMQFMPGTIYPYYTLVFTAAVLLSVLVKPYLRPRTFTYEIE